MPNINSAKVLGLQLETRVATQSRGNFLFNNSAEMQNFMSSISMSTPFSTPD